MGDENLANRRSFARRDIGVVAEIEKRRLALKGQVDIRPCVVEAIFDELGIEIAGHGFRATTANARRKG